MRYLIVANNSGGLYRFRKELMQRFIDDGHEAYAVTPFDEYGEELRALRLHLIEQNMNRRGKNPLQELQLLRDYHRRKVELVFCDDHWVVFSAMVLLS